MRNIGITGARGVIGSILRRKLTAGGHDCSCFDGDVTDPTDVREWISGTRPDLVFHLAAVVPTAVVKDSPLRAYAVNVAGTIHLLNEIAGLPQQRTWVFYASSAHVYASSSGPISEDSAIAPVSLYGKTKYLGEDVCTEAAKAGKYQIDVCIGRIFSYFHESQRVPFLYPTMLDRLNKEDLRQPFFLHGADSVRDFLNAEQVADILVKLMHRRSKGIFNIASGKGSRIRDFVQSLTPVPLNIETNGEKDFLVANIEKLGRELERQP